MMRNIVVILAASLAPVGLAGCASQKEDVSDPATHQSLSLLMPARIIVEPFTGLKSFDDDARPDGLEVVLRPVDAFGDPVKIAGHLLIELYRFRPASGERKGLKVEQWDIELTSAADQRKYWNHVTQMYEIPLMLGPEALALEPDQKFVIEVTYNLSLIHI